MPLFEFSPDAIRQLAPAEFAELGLFERADLQLRISPIVITQSAPS